MLKFMLDYVDGLLLVVLQSIGSAAIQGSGQC